MPRQAMPSLIRFIIANPRIKTTQQLKERLSLMSE